MNKTALVKTIIPGALSGGHSNAQSFEVVYQSDSNDGAFNFVVKLGSTRQDLRVTPKHKIVKLEMIQNAIEEILNPKQAAASVPASSSSSSSAPIPFNSNKAAAALAAAAYRKADQEKHAEAREKEKAAKHAREVHEKEKKLKAKIGQKNEAVSAFAEAWVDWEKKK